MPPANRPLPLVQLLLCGALIVTLSMGIRHAFGLWLQPITLAHDWTRGHFSIAIATQNLVWGLAGPFVGWWADRQGAFKVLWTGAALYALGLAGMALTTNHAAFVLTTGVTIGLAQACCTYAVIYGVLGRNISPDKRSWAMGITAAAGSFGQFLMVPLASTLLQRMDWSNALLALAITTLFIGPLAWGLKETLRAHDAGTPSAPAQDAKTALRIAFGHRDFWLLAAGYGVCGFQVTFLGVHLPSYLKDNGLPPEVATTALALVGLFNVFGTYVAGSLGQRLRKTWILTAIYFSRAVVMLVFIYTPLSPLSVGIFSATMGFLWLSTVPPTNAALAQMHGVQHLSMLGGIVFLSHQVGSFLGAWLSGVLYDLQGNYQMIWWLAIALGVVAALINLPIREDVRPKGLVAHA